MSPSYTRVKEHIKQGGSETKCLPILGTDCTCPFKFDGPKDYREDSRKIWKKETSNLWCVENVRETRNLKISTVECLRTYLCGSRKMSTTSLKPALDIHNMITKDEVRTLEFLPGRDSRRGIPHRQFVYLKRSGWRLSLNTLSRCLLVKTVLVVSLQTFTKIVHSHELPIVTLWTCCWCSNMSYGL